LSQTLLSPFPGIGIKSYIEVVNKKASTVCDISASNITEEYNDENNYLYKF